MLKLLYKFEKLFREKMLKSLEWSCFGLPMEAVDLVARVMMIAGVEVMTERRFKLCLNRVQYYLYTGSKSRSPTLSNKTLFFCIDVGG